MGRRVITLTGHPLDSLVKPGRPPELRELWADQYGSLVAAQLEPDRRYALIKVGAAQFAYTDDRSYLRALGQAWEAGFVPEPLPSARGRELAQAAPRLRGVDAALSALTPADVQPPARRFS